MYKVSSTWVHFLKVEHCRLMCRCLPNLPAISGNMLSTSSLTEPPFSVSRQNGLHCLTQYLDYTLYTVDKPVFLNILSVVKKRALNVPTAPFADFFFILNSVNLFLASPNTRIICRSMENWEDIHCQ